MGTRADFYVGRGKEAEWIGSIAWDGYPEGIDEAVLAAETPEEYRSAVVKFLGEEESATTPEMGWPWPWEDSRTTDFAYAFDDGKVFASCFGRRWCYPPHLAASNDDPKEVEFPDMSARRQMAAPGSKRSGVTVLSVK